MPKTQLVELQVENLGVIASAHLEFDAGFNVLTGETGAGKTLLVGALSLCTGSSEARYRRDTDANVHVSAVFVTGDDEQVLSRESSATGRLRASRNGMATSSEGLRVAGEELLVIHGQHDSLRLRNRTQVLKILDEFGAIDDSALRQLRQELARLYADRDSLGGDSGARQRELDFAQYQIDEIQALGITSANELDECLEELQLLSELRDDYEGLVSAIELLDGDADDAILSQFARVITGLPKGALASDFASLLAASLATARESVHDLRSSMNESGVDEDRIAALEHRVGALRQLARKYGGTLETALDTLKELTSLVDRRSNEEQSLEVLESQIEQKEELEKSLSASLLKERTSTAARLSERIGSQLRRVALQNATLDFEVSGNDGSNVSIRFRANPGQTGGDLSDVASGGELSRVLLALSLETVGDGLVAVFDEVDAGIGGAVAQQIGECLSELATRQQVIVVTHLASVAARAKRHYVVEKSQSDVESVAIVRLVEGEERVQEIARMLSGDAQSAEARALAHSLLSS
jgi:DNA repair protein RecN (Recombination protein N)